jgi:hypothetical protein
MRSARQENYNQLMKRLTAIAFCILLLTGCSSGRSADELQTLVDLAKTTGAIQELSYNSSYGPQSVWCMNLANEYIGSVMGFDGTNGDEDMGTVSQAYFRGCMGY